MDKKIFIINGSGGTGKDTFVNLFAECYGADKVWNYSSVDKVKRIARSENGLYNIAYATPNVKYNDIKYVCVLK